MTAHPQEQDVTRERQVVASLLYGSDRTPQIVAVEASGPATMRLYRRTAAEQLVTETAPFTPWLILPHEPAWPQLRGRWEAARLHGDAYYRWLVRLRDWPTFLAARELLEGAQQDWLGFRAPVEQYLALSGQTLFKGLEYADLVRLQLDIETTTLDPHATDARIILVTVSSNRSYEAALTGDEPTIFAQLREAIIAVDPDIIEGHNIFNFDLPYLRARAEAHHVPLNWGRDGSTLAAGKQQRFKVLARSVPFTPHYIYGRHILDTYQQIQRYDGAGALTSYGLKETIAALGLTRENRTFVAGTELAATWEHNREQVIRYALDDVRDVATLSELTAPTEFYQTQMLPRTFQRVATGGTGGKVDALLIRAYLMANTALPRPAPAQPYPGGFSEVREVGIFRPIIKCDVESLYPAIMLTEQIGPASDQLGVVLPLLRELTTRRLDAKVRERTSSGRERALWHGLQLSFKVLINSFYGYLGFSQAHFNDYAAAERVTLRGQELIKQVVAALERTGARAIEIDTDGVYFVPPAAITSQAGEEAYVAEIGRTLPLGINLAFDGRFAGMISLKTKNYVLKGYDGALTMHGSSLRSRREEPYLRQFLYDAADLFSEGSRDDVRALYFATARRLQSHALTPRDFCRWETITENTFTSEANRRLAEVAQGQRIGERLEVYQRADGTLGLIEQWQQDEDVTYLLRRLRDVAARFADLYNDPADFAYAFPLLKAHSDLDAQEARTPTKQLTLFS
ncbi:MAG: DNA polymerase domain-containing protein [Thermomicrobiales bacterium]